MEKIASYFDLILRDAGIAFFLVILFGVLVIVSMILNKINGGQSKEKRIQANFLDTEPFEN